MKQAIYLIAALLLVGAASAVTVDCDAPGWWNTNVCQDYELQEEFDEVTNSIEGVANSVEEVGATVSSNDAAWRAGDGDGIDLDSVVKYVMGDFIKHLQSLFANKESFEALQDKNYELEAKLYLLSENIEWTEEGVFYKAVALKMEEQQSADVYFKGYHCAYHDGSVSCTITI